MTKQQSKRPLINIEYKVVEPFVYATALGLAAGGPAAFSGNFWGGFVCGSSFSFIWYWGSNNLTRPKKSKPKTNVGAGSLIINGRKVSRGFEYAPYQPRFINRETWRETIRRLVMGNLEPRANAISIPTPKPRWMTEFIFYGQYQGQEIQLLESDVTRFLNAAWRRRKKGVGLSERHWVRKISERPQWYKNVGATFYYALIDLLWEVELMSGRQLIIPVGWQQNALAKEPHQILEALRWAQAQKGNINPNTSTNELIIGTGGVSSFEG